MSEDDRAAKAARARALLKKRQAQKAAEHGAATSSPSRVASPVPRIASPAPSPSSRTSTPAPAEQPPPSVPTPSPPEKPQERNLADLFAKEPSVKDSDSSSWLSGLTRVESNPSPPVSPAPKHKETHSAAPPVAAPEREDLRALVRDQRKAIESLEAEKASLAGQLDHLSQVEAIPACP
ncbi:hypothetical protein GY45DRAFT_41187 [Cubamyces sp. BRFM 1775]|nr:hypothetical protein GY45DRAFT_41187 [Cubamyces sp. BRFM 1775]